MAVHPTAVIDKQAEIDKTAEIGPYVVIEGPVRIGPNTTVRAHAFLDGWTQIGEGCEIHPFAVVGHLPQDFHFGGERTYCKIGDRVVIREGATIHRGTQPESSTTVGDECFLMAYSHIGHNCELSKGAKVYNMAALSGHVEVGENAIISGYSLIHQFARIGKLAFIAAASRISMDVPPFFMAYGESTVIQHNILGMRRAGYGEEDLREIRSAFRALYRSGKVFREGLEGLAASVRTPAGRELVAFLQAESRRGICAAGRTNRQRLQQDGARSGDSEPDLECD
jgi:UDP-N-acetylglucosamine acyltransferase